MSKRRRKPRFNEAGRQARKIRQFTEARKVNRASRLEDWAAAVRGWAVAFLKTEGNLRHD
jgi:hypothetical protein